MTKGHGRGQVTRRIPAVDAAATRVAQNLRQRRIAKGLTQEALAGRIGVTYQQMHKYESGVNRVSAGMLWVLARELDCQVGELFAGLSDGAQGLKLTRSRELLEIMARVQGLMPSTQQALHALVYQVALEADVARARNGHPGHGLPRNELQEIAR